MVKAADALAEAGYAVRVISTACVDWAIRADRHLHGRRLWRWQCLHYSRSHLFRYLWSGLRQKSSRAIAKAISGGDTWKLVARAQGRLYPELVGAITSESADLVYGGTFGALPAIMEAARRLGIPYAVDLEDFHTGEGWPDAIRRAWMERIESRVLESASFATTASDAMAAAYAGRYSIQPITIHNTFSLPRQEPSFRVSNGALRLYWFSQRIGPGRGLEEAVLAMGQAGIAGELHLRGRPAGGYLNQLRQLGNLKARRLEIVWHAPSDPDSMVSLARGHDVGLALEQPLDVNRQICMTNKVFTYMLAGLALALTDTPGQQVIARHLQGNAITYEPRDIGRFADQLLGWHRHRERLLRAQRASWEAANRRWHWDHPLEKDTLLQEVARVTG